MSANGLFDCIYRGCVKLAQRWVVSLWIAVTTLGSLLAIYHWIHDKVMS